MFRLATFVALQMALISVALEPTLAGEYGTADEAKAMLERAVAAVKEDKAKALDAFNKGEGVKLEKHTFFTKVRDQDCGVGYYKQ